MNSFMSEVNPYFFVLSLIGVGYFLGWCHAHSNVWWK